MGRCGEYEHQGQGVQSGMLPRRENMHTSRSHRSKDQQRCQQHDENEHKKVESRTEQLPQNVPKLLLGHPKIVPQFMYESLANLMTDFCLLAADVLNIFLIKN